MKRFFLLSSLLFYILCTSVFFFAGLYLAKILGVGDGQGLAAAAIVLSYGFVTGFVALVFSVLIIRSVSRKNIFRMNVLLFALLAIIFILIGIRISSRQHQNELSGVWPGMLKARLTAGLNTAGHESDMQINRTV